MLNKEIDQIEDYLNTKVKEDPLLVKKLLRVSFSPYTNNPINLGVMASSSTGKSYAVTNVLELFPKKDVLFIGKMSPTALIHQKGVLEDYNGKKIQPILDDLDRQLKEDPKNQNIINLRRNTLTNARIVVTLSNKILVFLEPPNIQLWDLLKPILSHDKKEIEYQTTFGDGSLKVKKTIIRGWPAVIFCSAKDEAKNRIWEEIETRFDIASPNTSIKKYRKAIEFTSMKMGIPGFAKKMAGNTTEEAIAKRNVLKIIERIKRLSKNDENPIWNPFWRTLGSDFPGLEGVWMRHSKRFMSYCNIETLINSKYNVNIEFQKNDDLVNEYVITSLEDIRTTIDLLGEISSIPPQQLKFFHEIFVPLYEEIRDIELGVTSEQLAKYYEKVYGVNISSKKILENYLTPLTNQGTLGCSKNPSDKRQNIYYISSNPNTNNLSFLLERIIEESNNNDSFIEEGIKELESYSKDNGKIKRIFVNDKDNLTLNEIQGRILNIKSNMLNTIQA